MGARRYVDQHRIWQAMGSLAGYLEATTMRMKGEEPITVFVRVIISMV